MGSNYDINWLLKEVDNGEALDYLFFWGHTNKYDEAVGKACFSQWFESPFTIEGTTYKTAEHWMMAQKALLFGDTDTFEKIIQAEKPSDVKKLGRQVANFNEERWNERRFEIVKIGNIHKFNQHPALANYLLSIDEKIIVEASPVDAIWGIGLPQDSQHAVNPQEWRGLNLLGFVLMEVRDILNEIGHFSEIQNPVPLPWEQYPGVDSRDMFWRMGKGEELITEFSKFYSTLSNREKKIFAVLNPTPPTWKSFFYD